MRTVDQENKLRKPERWRCSTLLAEPYAAGRHANSCHHGCYCASPTGALHVIRWTLLVCLTLLSLSTTSGCDDPSPPLRVAVTTSTHNTGLLDIIEPAFEKATGLNLRCITVGSGRALQLGRQGDVDVIWLHDRGAEAAFVEAGHGVDRRDVMWNDFIIVGPKSDPAQLRGSTDAIEALRKLNASSIPFVSRGDDSGTHRREMSLRALLPSSEQTPNIVVAGLGMGATLLMAHEKEAYTLTDRGTWLAYRDKVDLEACVEGDEMLRNPYGAIRINPARHPDTASEAASKFLDFLTGAEGQTLIREFRIQGEALFHVAPSGNSGR